MLGHKLVYELGKKHEVYAGVRGNGSILVKTGICRPERVVHDLDATRLESIEAGLFKTQPEVVINAVGSIKQRSEAMTKVNAITINSIFPHRLAAIASNVAARVVTFSTDCVFDGATGGYTEADFPNAKDLYGKSKALGEVYSENCVTIRSSIIGRELSGQKSLLEWILSNRGGNVKGFAGAQYSGFTTLEMARILDRFVLNESGLHGVVHISSNRISKYDLLRLVNEHFELGMDIEEETDFCIDRTLDSDAFRKLTGFKPNSWNEMIKELAADPSPYEVWRESKA